MERHAAQPGMGVSELGSWTGATVSQAVSTHDYYCIVIRVCTLSQSSTLPSLNPWEASSCFGSPVYSDCQTRDDTLLPHDG
jgi:hypothetical protein